MERQQRITELLNSEFAPSYLDIENESHMHSVPENSETHFKVVMVSSVFESLNKVKRHQKVYGLLSPLMQEGLHAIALHLYTSEEWAQRQETVPASPNCMGGSKHG